MIKEVLATLKQREAVSVAALGEWLAIPSVSARPEHADDCRRAAVWLGDHLADWGLRTQLMETGGGKGNPILIARNEHKAGRPTVLLYGHYDVQPAEPLELWATPAFSPTVRPDAEGHAAVFARGACDDKGQVWAHAEAIAAWQAHGGLPVNLIALIEGEEEVGSTNLEHFVADHADELRADICVISDTSSHDRNTPALTYGLRGLVYEEMFLTGPSHDLHSGGYGGAAPNPANALAALIASLHDPVTGRVNLPGFYDDVAALSEAEKAAWAKLGYGERELMAEIGTDGLSGEKAFGVLERLWARPTCDVNGLTSGYQAAGAKTVLPSKASAKLSFRLVPNQDPAKVRATFEAEMRRRCPAGVKIEFVNHGMSPAAVVPVDTKPARLALEAMAEGFGRPATFVRGGGSIPVVGLFKSVLGLDTLLVGMGLPDDRAHSPNEKMDIAMLHGGARTAAILYGKLAALGK